MTRLAQIRERLEKATPGDSAQKVPSAYLPPEEATFSQIAVLTRAIELHKHAPSDLAALLEALDVAVEALEKFKVYPLPAPGPIGNEAWQALKRIEEILK